ncbi:relaxosome protein TraM [Klebsiella variicola]|uniref:relaxosome protein TraM n=1 Tax=Klebsiella variicola TaxID=244366 RepID=UPI000D74B638|nr:relaxosome protein TraM [Klebsiella variicola]HCI6142964.1 conjugal transfer protein TraM [Klebsiella variicola subsp. variicola]EIY5154361.1 conjugal transfer protein TraM [Klebsiella variicola]MDE4678680.1 relaxosome protein TraM [Klebsiella variicola]PXL02046.1 conjugal transfer protein TraM [Klebsiella variicola]SXF79814.1 conjugal transfer protein TraM [Klebsiella variicola]
MPRQNVYMKQRTLDSIREIVNERREEGDSHAEANISSVCSEILELGIRVYLSAKVKREDEALSQQDKIQLEIMAEAVKSRLVAQQILKLMFDLQEIKADTRNNYASLIDWLKSQTQARIKIILSDD